MHVNRARIVHIALAVFALSLIAQAARVQLLEGSEWAERAKRQQYRSRSLDAPRGRILDASGNMLAESRELLRLSIAPREVRSRAELASAMRASGFAPQTVRMAQDTARRWIVLPGLHVGAEVAQVASLPGVHAETVLNREYTTVAGVKQMVSGIESSLDSILAGESTRTMVARDVRGRRIDSPDTWTRDPRPGSTVTLTINRDLQEICERALVQATDSLEAAGGDIIVLNPRTGEVLAMASRRLNRPSMSNTAVSEPFEPGSTLKPFIAAALLERKKAHVDEVIETFNGTMTIGSRTITDLHRAPRLSLADVIRYSSNIGIVRFGARLTPRETFETLRDLGFGTPTGVPLPGEADGVLRRPSQWQSPSAASLAMGYEISVTPLQLASAYSALTNNGELMQPHVVREIRNPDGEVVYRMKPRVIRHVFRPEVASEVRSMLVNVVSSGTGVRADLATFKLAGKSGTARRAAGGRYVEGSYTASFVGLFPAERPQYVVLVKIDEPRRAIYGGEVAAPVSAVVLRAALAARDAALDRDDLAHEERAVTLGVAVNAKAAEGAKRTRPVFPSADVADGLDDEESRERAPDRAPQSAQLVTLPYVAPEAIPDRSERPVPDVSGMRPRSAVRALHQAGFKVQLVKAQSTTTIPAGGTMLPAGSVVKLSYRP